MKVTYKTQNYIRRKNQYEKVTFKYKLFEIDQIENCHVSANYSAKKI